MPCGPGGPQHDYVPFFFAPRPPMFYTIHKGNVRDARQNQILHLVSSVERVAASGCIYVSTDGHTIMAFTEFFDDANDLDKVDWGVMQLRYWYDTRERPDRKRQRQGEFLAHRFVRWEAVEEIGVENDRIRTNVQLLLRDRPHQPLVRIRRDWYYY
ncbi:MAG: type II toxin-antitoxin system toxin DNA ADP-ribosyl transferase DarT [Dehalococcoidia bacterium]